MRLTLKPNAGDVYMRFAGSKVKKIQIGGEGARRDKSHKAIRKFRIVQTEGSRQVEREVDAYNLDVILSVGYRVRSVRGTQFRRWATTVLREYLVKGFAMDDTRLKQAEQWDYFDEWLARIRDIRGVKGQCLPRVKRNPLTISRAEFRAQKGMCRIVG